MITMLRPDDGCLPVATGNKTVYEVTTNQPWYDDLYAVCDEESRLEVIREVESNLNSLSGIARVVGLEDVTWMCQRHFHLVLYHVGDERLPLVACSMSRLLIDAAFAHLGDTARVDRDELTETEVRDALAAGTPFVEAWQGVTVPMSEDDVEAAILRIPRGPRDGQALVATR